MDSLKQMARKYRLPNPTTPEDLECRWSKTLIFGDKVILAGYYYPGYFGATYEFLSDNHTCEGEIGLRSVSDIAFLDDGHAILWAIEN